MLIILALGNVWYPAIMNSAEEVNDVVNLARQHDLAICGNGIFGIDGSTNLDPFSDFEFSDGYIPNSSGKFSNATDKTEQNNDQLLM